MCDGVDVGAERAVGVRGNCVAVRGGREEGGASGHSDDKEGQVECVCGCCSGKHVFRKDDQPGNVLDRLMAYHEQAEPLVDFYRQRGKLAAIPFNDSIEATTAEIMKALEA